MHGLLLLWASWGSKQIHQHVFASPYARWCRGLCPVCNSSSLSQALRDRQQLRKTREKRLAMLKGSQLRAEEPTGSSTGSEVRGLKKWQNLPGAWSRLKGL